MYTPTFLIGNTTSLFLQKRSAERQVRRREDVQGAERYNGTLA